jgi:hypothetical protein
MLPERHIHPLDAKDDELFVAEEITARTPSATEHDLGRAALAAVASSGMAMLAAMIRLRIVQSP